LLNARRPFPRQSGEQIASGEQVAEAQGPHSWLASGRAIAPCRVFRRGPVAGRPAARRLIDVEVHREPVVQPPQIPVERGYGALRAVTPLVPVERREGDDALDLARAARDPWAARVDDVRRALFAGDELAKALRVLENVFELRGVAAGEGHDEDRLAASKGAPSGQALAVHALGRLVDPNDRAAASGQPGDRVALVEHRGDTTPGTRIGGARGPWQRSVGHESAH